MSRRTALTIARRLLSTSSATAFLALAACSDSLTAPASNAALRPSEPDAGFGASPITPRVSTVWVTLQLVDQGGPFDAGVPGTTVEFKTNVGGPKSVVDNTVQDTDARVGYYRVSMPTAIAYTATVNAAPVEFSLAGATKTVSAFVTPTLVSMGQLVMYRKPGLTVSLYHNGALVAGQTIKVTGPNGWTKTVTDGGANDEDHWGAPGPSDGKVSMRLPQTGTYTVCALTSPQLFFEAKCTQAWAIQYFVSYSATLTYEQAWFIPKF